MNTKTMVWLWLAVTPTAAGAKNLEQLATDCSAGKQKACIEFPAALEAERNDVLRKAGVQRLKDKDLLKTIALEDRAWQVRAAAVKQLTDQTILAAVAKTDKEWYVREAAAKQIADQALLTDIAQQDPVGSVRAAAVVRVADQGLLVAVAQRDSDAVVRATAAARLTDASVLATLAKSDADWRVRKAAVDKSTDQALLAAIAKTDSEADVRRAAVERLSDAAVLAGVARSDSDPLVREVAVGKLKDPGLLARIAENDDNAEVRAKATLAINAAPVKGGGAQTDAFTRASSLCSAAARKKAPTATQVPTPPLLRLVGDADRWEESGVLGTGSALGGVLCMKCDYGFRSFYRKGTRQYGPVAPAPAAVVWNRKWTVRLLRWPNGELVAEKVFKVSTPGSITEEQATAGFGPTAAELEAWLAGLGVR